MVKDIRTHILSSEGWQANCCYLRTPSILNLLNLYIRLRMLNLFQAAIDIMEKENAFLVDRPPSIAVGEIGSGGMRLVLMGQGERFRKLRK